MSVLANLEGTSLIRDAILPKGAFKSPANFEIASLNVGKLANLSISDASRCFPSIDKPLISRFSFSFAKTFLRSLLQHQVLHKKKQAL